MSGSLILIGQWILINQYSIGIIFIFHLILFILHSTSPKLINLFCPISLDLRFWLLFILETYSKYFILVESYNFSSLTSLWHFIEICIEDCLMLLRYEYSLSRLFWLFPKVCAPLWHSWNEGAIYRAKSMRLKFALFTIQCAFPLYLIYFFFLLNF